MAAPPVLSRLLAPTLRKERTETRKTPDIGCPAFGASSRKEGEVYHISQSQGQTQFVGIESPQQSGRLGKGFGGVEQFLATVGGAVGRLDDPGRLAGADLTDHRLEPRDKVAGAPRKTEARQNPTGQEGFHLIREVRRGRELGLGRAREGVLARGRLHRGAVGGDP